MEGGDYNTRMLRRCALAAGGLVAAFHVWLFAAQVWSGHVAQPEVLVRWLLAAALVAGLASLGRRGLPVVFGRHAVAVWVLAALLHGPALANDLDGFATPSMPAVVTLAQSLLPATALALALLALCLRAATAGAVPLRSAATRAKLHAWPGGAGVVVGFLPRPPPLRQVPSLVS
jgi:hypothetical protein